ncbi:MAG: LptF/LptG family permease [Verrucomicrobiota bacterium]
MGWFSLRQHSPFRFLGGLTDRIKKVPWLGTLLALAGAALWTGLTVRDLLALTDDAHTAIQVNAVIHPQEAFDLAYSFFAVHWLKLMACMAPALAVAVLKLRRLELLLPITLVCGWLFLWWLGSDLHQNLAGALSNPLGLVATPAAYFVKLGLVAFLILSVPLLWWLYYRATLMDQYLVRNFVFPFLLCICGISGIMITMDLLNNARDFVDAKFGFGRIVLYYLVVLPKILVTITEAALLLATLYSLGRMSRYNEVTSMMSAGRSVTRVIAPVLIFGAWCALAVAALNYQLAPKADRESEEMRSEDKKAGRKAISAEYNVPYRNREDRRTWLIYKLPYDLSEKNSISEVWVIQQDENGNPKQVIMAKKASWDPVKRLWTFYQAQVTVLGPDMKWVQLRAEERLPILENWKETPGSILSDRLSPEFLGVPELISYLRTNHSLPARSLAKYEATMHWRFALPFRCFLLVLLAAPLGIVSGRRGLLGGVSTAVGLFFGVYFFSSLALKAGEGLYLPPAAGAWAVNGIFLVVGLLMLIRRSRNRRPWTFSLNPLKWFTRRA